MKCLFYLKSTANTLSLSRKRNELTDIINYKTTRKNRIQERNKENLKSLEDIRRGIVNYSKIQDALNVTLDLNCNSSLNKNMNLEQVASTS